MKNRKSQWRVAKISQIPFLQQRHIFFLLCSELAFVVYCRSDSAVFYASDRFFCDPSRINCELRDRSEIIVILIYAFLSSPWIWPEGAPFAISTARLLASPRAIARNEHQPAATFVPRLCRLWEKFVERRIRARHSPRVFLATHAREVCRERPLNHNHNGGRIALPPKCTSAKQLAAVIVFFIHHFWSFSRPMRGFA